LCRQGKLTGFTIKFKQILHVTSSNNKKGFSSEDEETFSDSFLLDSLILRLGVARDLLAATDRREGAISPLLHLCLLAQNNNSNGRTSRTSK
jgi:hypothetical protein